MTILSYESMTKVEQTSKSPCEGRHPRPEAELRQPSHMRSGHISK